MSGLRPALQAEKIENTESGGVATLHTPATGDQAFGLNDHSTSNGLAVEALGVQALSPAFLTEWFAIADHPMALPFVMVNCWRELCRADGELAIFAIRRGGVLVGVVPLIRAQGVVRRWIAPSHAEVGRVVFAMREEPRVVLQAVFAELTRRGCDVIEMPTVTTDSPTYAGLRETARATGMSFIEDFTCDVPHKALTGGWDEFWKSINGDTRRKFGQQERRLQKLGALDYAVWHGGDGLSALLDECFEIEASGYKGAQGTAIKFREAEGRFWRAFTADAAAADVLWIYTLRLDGRLISYEISIKRGGVLYAMKHGTDVRVEAQAPGNALHLNIFKQEVAAGECRIYDFAGEMTEWKRRWSKETWPMMGIRLFAPTLRGRVALVIGPLLRRGLKRLPGLKDFVERLRGQAKPGTTAHRDVDAPGRAARADKLPVAPAAPVTPAAPGQPPLDSPVETEGRIQE